MTERHNDRKTERQRDRMTKRQKGRKTERHIDKKTKKQKDKKTKRQKHKKTKNQATFSFLFCFFAVAFVFRGHCIDCQEATKTEKQNQPEAKRDKMTYM